MFRSDPMAKPVQWYEGMLLSPQHFQQSQIYNEQQIRCALATASPFYWGISELELEEGELGAGVVTVKRLFCVMSDGLVVDFDSSRGRSLSIDLNETERAEQPGPQRWRVHLAVPRRTEASASGSARFRRYESIRGERHRDENTGEVGEQIVRLHPVLSLSVSERSDAYVRLGIIEVDRADDGTFSKTRYVPPLLRVSSSHSASWLGGELASSLVALADKIRRKAAGLAERQKRQGGGQDEGLARGPRAQIQALVGGLVPFELLAESGNAHPFEMYAALGSLLSTVASLEPSGIPAKLRRYDHDDIEPGFSAAVRRVESIVDRVQLKFSTQEMKRAPTEEDPDRHVMRIPADWRFDELWIELEARPGRGRRQLEQWMEACRIVSDPVDAEPGAGSKLQRLRRERTLGVVAEPTDGFAHLGVEADEQRALFRLPIDGDLVRRGEQLEISCTDSSLRAAAPRAIVFYVGTDATTLAPGTSD